MDKIKVERFLFHPLKNSYTTQTFGQDKTCVDKETNSKYVGKSSKAECPVGYISLYKKMGMNGHNGIDFHAKLWQPIYASCDGFVEEVQTNEKVGLGVGVVTDNKYYCAETESYVQFKYRNWHFQAINVVKGQKVKTGDLLGWAGMTGYATGVHDHFEVKPVAMGSDGKYYNLLQKNGYFGAIDPSPYLNKVCAVDSNALKKAADLLAKILEGFTDLLRNTQKK